MAQVFVCFFWFFFYFLFLAVLVIFSFFFIVAKLKIQKKADGAVFMAQVEERINPNGGGGTGGQA